MAIVRRRRAQLIPPPSCRSYRPSHVPLHREILCCQHTPQSTRGSGKPMRRVSSARSPSTRSPPRPSSWLWHGRLGAQHCQRRAGHGQVVMALLLDGSSGRCGRACVSSLWRLAAADAPTTRRRPGASCLSPQTACETAAAMLGSSARTALAGLAGGDALRCDLLIPFWAERSKTREQADFAHCGPRIQFSPMRAAPCLGGSVSLLRGRNALDSESLKITLKFTGSMATAMAKIVRDRSSRIATLAMLQPAGVHLPELLGAMRDVARTRRALYVVGRRRNDAPPAICAVSKRSLRLAAGEDASTASSRSSSASPARFRRRR